MSDSIKAAVKDATKAAMKAKERERLAIIRMISAEFKRIEVDERIEVDYERALVILDKMLKQRKDSISQYKDAGREDLVAIEEAEVAVIKDFLPEQLTEEEISALIDSAITESGAESMKDMGKVMAIVKPKAQGRADIGKLSGLVKAKLN